MCLSAHYLRSGSLKDRIQERQEKREMPLFLDSGAFQSDGDIDWEEVMSIARDLEPELVVIDDVLGRALKTVARLRKRAKHLDEFDLVAPLQVVDRPDNIPRYVKEYERLGYEYVGIPYHQLREKSPEELDTVLRKVGNESDLTVHVLGAPIKPEYVSVYQRHRVYSVDSSTHIGEFRRSRGPTHLTARAATVANFLNKV